MIIEYDENGRIFHIVQDPVLPSQVAAFADRGVRFVNVPPVALPDIPATDEDGQPIYDMSSEPMVDEDGNPLRDEQGEVLFRDVNRQRMITGRTESADVDFTRDYVRDGTVQARPTFDIQPEIILSRGETYTISGLPVPCRAIVDSQSLLIEDGTLELTGDDPGTFAIVLDQWPYLPATLTVTVNEV